IGHLLCILPPNIPNRITTIPNIRVPEQPLHIQSNAIWNQTLTNIPRKQQWSQQCNKYDGRPRQEQSIIQSTSFSFI
ncbi:MAG: hypothetical protein EZS28_043945, partial [Streblomastix strix]